MITLAVLPVFALLVAAPSGPEDGCPSGRQVTEAMQARFPGLLVMSDQALGSGRADILRATLDVAPDGTVVRFSLIDPKGEVQLRRTLQAPGRSRSTGDCLALADTVAAIVERYLGAITYDAAETPQPPADAFAAPGGDITKQPTQQASPRRSGLVFVGAGWRSNTGTTISSDQSGIEGRLGVQFELTRTFPRIAALASLGATSALALNLSDGQRVATLRRYPGRLGIVLELQAGRGWIEPGLQFGVDVLTLSSARRVDVPADLKTRFSPVVEATVGYRLRVAGRFYLRPAAAISVPLKTYEYGLRAGLDAMTGEGERLLTTPRVYASLGIDGILVFR